MGTSNQSSLTSFGAARSFRRRTAWCWNVAPRIPVTGEVHDQIQVDGIYVGSWCCLIAVAGEHVLGWQWCDIEKKAAWAALLGRFPAPRVVITDGGSGIAAAMSECWSETAVQRCLVHVQRKAKAIAPTERHLGPELYSTGLSAEEGLWHREGWAGRSCHTRDIHTFCPTTLNSWSCPSRDRLRWDVGFCSIIRIDKFRARGITGPATSAKRMI